MRKHVAEAGIVLLVALALLVAGCIAPTPATQPVVQTRVRDSFNARSESEDGLIAEWSGYTDDYQPGQAATIDLRFANQASETWPVRYCLQLADDEHLVESLAQEEFTLHPSGAMGRPRVIELPDDLEAGAYALVLVVRRPQGPAANSVTIHVGDTNEIYRSTRQAIDEAMAACLETEGTAAEE